MVVHVVFEEHRKPYKKILISTHCNVLRIENRAGGGSTVFINASTVEAEAGRLPAQSSLQRKFQDSQGYAEKPCLEKQANKQEKKSYKIILHEP